MKALTFSYDDGQYADKRLTEIFNKYGMKCTFNLNGAHLVHSSRINEGQRKLSIEDMRELYAGHEIALHGYSHPLIADLSREMCELEIIADKVSLTEAFGKTPVGMAYPYGHYSDLVVDVLREQGVKYSRTTRATYNFKPQTDLLRFDPTCHHKAGNLMELAKEFAEAEPTEPMLFYVWGHSFEFEREDNFDIIERFCEYLTGRDDVFFGTNEECLL